MRSVDELTALRRFAPVTLTDEHIAAAGAQTTISASRAVLGRDGRTFFYYVILDNQLVWPHAALELFPPGRQLTVSVVRPLDPYAPGMSRRRPNGHSQPPADYRPPVIDPRRLYIGGIPYVFTEAELLRLLRNVGGLSRIAITIDRMTGRSKGFGHALYVTDSDAQRAIEYLNGNRVIHPGFLASDFASGLAPDWVRASLLLSSPPPRATFKEGEELDRIDETERLVALVQQFSHRLVEWIATYPHHLDLVEWRDMERVLGVAFSGLGFEVQITNASKDGGIDLRLESRGSTYFVQVKHWPSGKRVGGEYVREFVALTVSSGARAGIFLSTSGFTSSAFQGMAVIERQRLRIGNGGSIVSLCRIYSAQSSGVMLPTDPEEALFQHTLGLFGR